jgi:pimeloyl-ACP methyl ester carboxylesterase
MRITDHQGLPVRHARARVNGIRVHYVTAGAGPALLLVHGTPKTHSYWTRLIPLLSSRFTIVAPDLRGFGDSDRPTTSDGYSSVTMTDDLAGLMEQLGFAEYSVHGEDRGAEYAYVLAGRFRDRVTHLSFSEMMLSGMGLEELGFFTEENLTARMRRKGTWKWHNPFFYIADLPEFLIAGKEREFWTWWMRAEMWDPSALPDEAVDEWIGHLASPGGLRALLDTYRAPFSNAATNRELAQRTLEIPVLAIGAREFYGEYVGEQMRRVATRVTEHVWDDCGHSLALEQPERLASVLAEFLTT